MGFLKAAKCHPWNLHCKLTYSEKLLCGIATGNICKHSNIFYFYNVLVLLLIPFQIIVLKSPFIMVQNSMMNPHVPITQCQQFTSIIPKLRF